MSGVEVLIRRIQKNAHNIKNIDVSTIDFTNVLFPFFERVHHTLLLPAVPKRWKDVAGNEKDNTVKYEKKVTLFNEHKQQDQKFYVRSSGERFRLLPNKELLNLRNKGRLGCYSYGRFINEESSIQEGLFLAHVFDNDLGSFDSPAGFIKQLRTSFHDACIGLDKVRVESLPHDIVNISCVLRNEQPK